MASYNRLKYPKQSRELIFIDNDSTDNSLTYFTKKYGRQSDVCIIHNDKNYGYAGGNNSGFRVANGDYIAVCNSDLELDPNWLDELVDAALRTEADVVVPKLVYADTRLINNAGSDLVPDSDWPNQERGMNEPASKPEFNKEVEITSFCGASPLIKRSFLEEVGLFDGHFFLYWEDVDLAWRGQKAGKKYTYAPRAVAYHHTSGSSGGEQSPTFIYYVGRNRILILLKNGRPRYILKAFAKVGRDHVFYKIHDLYHAVINRSGRKQAARALLLGVKIIAGSLLLSPVIIAKRWKFVREKTL